MLSVKPTNPSQLDPGPEPRTKSARRIGICRFFCNAFITVSVIVGLFVCYLGAIFARGVWRSLQMPHPNLYHNDAQYEDHQVVRPLIEEDQAFDIVATVWIRDFVGKNPSHARGIELIERPIFTDTVFRGVKMSKKIYKTSVNLEIPTAAFQDTLLGNYDLRGSFVLVPNPPSPMGNLMNYSIWVPPEALRPPTRAYPNDYTRTLADEAVDAYGITTPLLSFHDVKSRCRTNEQINVSPSLNSNESNFNPQAWTPVKPRNKLEITTEGKPVLQSHPYIITKTHLNIMDMTKLYKREAFEAAHRKLSMIECGERSHTGLRSPDSPPDWRLCHTAFYTNGNFEVVIEYPPEEEKINSSSTLVYAPYLFVDPTAWGPFDLTAVPVNREECSPINQDPDIVNITWNISFKSITPRKELIASVVGRLLRPPVNMTGTEETLQSSHLIFEFAQALLGQRFSEDRPSAWVAWPLLYFSMALRVVDSLLRPLYWYNLSLTSTTGISIIGTTCLAIGLFVDKILQQMTREKFIPSLSTLFYYLPLIMLKAATRLEFVWYNIIWIISLPVGLEFARATHAERTSQRVEARTSWRFRQLCFILLALVYFLADISQFYVIYPKGRRPEPIDASIFKRTLSLCQSLISLPMMILGRTLQIVMNFQSKTFAGMYKIVAFCAFLSSLSGIVACYIRPEVLVDGLPLHIVLVAVGNGVTAFQALIYPTPEAITDSDDD